MKNANERLALTLLFGLVALAVQSVPVFTADWGPVQTADLGFNYEDAVTVEHGLDDGEVTLIFTNVTTKTDTAWSLVLPQFKVRGGAEFAVFVRSRGNVKSMDGAFGVQGRIPAVLWYDKDDQPLMTVDALGKDIPLVSVFSFRSQGADWIRFVSRGTVPEQACFGRLRLGADSPDIRPGRFLEIAELAYHERGGREDPWTFDAEERKDVRETVGKEDFSKYSGKASTNGVVTFRDDGMTLVDGKPFFPIGTWAFERCPINGNSVDRGIWQLKQIGCNAVHTYSRFPGRTVREIGEACEKHGMKFFGEFVSRDYSQEKLRGEARAKMQCEVADWFRNRGILLYWVVGDDTADHRSPEDVMRDTMVIRSADPSVRTMSVDVIPAANRYFPYVHACDVISPEIYPFKSESPYPDELGKVVASMNATLGDMKRAGGMNKGLVPVFQAFKGFSSWHRLPTPEEVRSMTYAALALGARGATFYPYYSSNTNNLSIASTRESFKSFARLALELSSLTSHLVERDAKVQPKVKLPEGAKAQVVRLLKDGPDGRLLIAVNVSEEAADAAFDLGGGSSTWEAVSEKREVCAERGVLRDRFGARETHVYRERFVK